MKPQPKLPDYCGYEDPADWTEEPLPWWAPLLMGGVILAGLAAAVAMALWPIPTMVCGALLALWMLGRRTA